MNSLQVWALFLRHLLKYIILNSLLLFVNTEPPSSPFFFIKEMLMVRTMSTDPAQPSHPHVETLRNPHLDHWPGKQARQMRDTRINLALRVLRMGRAPQASKNPHPRGYQQLWSPGRRRLWQPRLLPSTNWLPALEASSRKPALGQEKMGKEAPRGRKTLEPATHPLSRLEPNVRTQSSAEQLRAFLRIRIKVAKLS